jgi:hypothetical protein
MMERLAFDPQGQTQPGCMVRQVFVIWLSSNLVHEKAVFWGYALEPLVGDSFLGVIK